jgi:hypothetical protein
MRAIIALLVACIAFANASVHVAQLREVDTHTRHGNNGIIGGEYDLCAVIQ